jgi:2-aminoethylphosphonate-pyruvate transaminase
MSATALEARRVRFDASVAASGRRPAGVPGMGFVGIRKAILDGCKGRSQSLAMDLHDQKVYMEKTGHWRFTPPTNVVAALPEAIGPKPFLAPQRQGPITVTFRAPEHPASDLRRFYAAADTLRELGIPTTPR